jgi:hypothetical protein
VFDYFQKPPPWAAISATNFIFIAAQLKTQLSPTDATKLGTSKKELRTAISIFHSNPPKCNNPLILSP